MTARVALATAAAARAEDEDLAPIERALSAAAMSVDCVDWDDPHADWAGYDLVVIRSTWDYVGRYEEYLEWVDRVGAATRLVNEAAVIRWNTDKRYLAELSAQGIPVVETEFAATPDELAALALPVDREFVVKPTVSAGSRDTRRYRPTEHSEARAQAVDLLGAGRPVMIQPYQSAVDHEGETALFYFGGEFSHAIRKGPLLALDAPPTRALFAEEQIGARVPSAAQRAAGDAVIAALPGVAALAAVAFPLPYARVDVLTDESGGIALLELELAEPSLFVGTDPGAATRFAATITALLGP